MSAIGAERKWRAGCKGPGELFHPNWCGKGHLRYALCAKQIFARDTPHFRVQATIQKRTAIKICAIPFKIRVCYSSTIVSRFAFSALIFVAPTGRRKWSILHNFPRAERMLAHITGIPAQIHFLGDRKVFIEDAQRVFLQANAYLSLVGFLNCSA